MKIDFNEKGMTVNFDKVPKFLYFNEESKGCGKIFLDGNQVKLLQDVRMHAHTRDNKSCYPLEYVIMHGEKGQFGSKTISSNVEIKPFATISVKDTDIFIKLVNILKKILSDAEIPLEAIKKYRNDFDSLFISNPNDKTEDENDVK